MARQNKKKEYEGLVSFIKEKQSAKWKSMHNDRTLYEAYEELRKNLAEVLNETEKGAMATEVTNKVDEIKNKLQEDIPYEEAIGILEEFPILYLNNHGEEHVNKVIERADQIIEHFWGERPSEFESFILLCAISIHDIGNALGREFHEKKLASIFDEKAQNIVIDKPEKRVIKSIASCHGGRNKNGSKDTISSLLAKEDLFEESVRTRMLAAILRLADELADDHRRASRCAIELDIVGEYSKIFQEYSNALHTVKLSDNNDYGCTIDLVYELQLKDLEYEYTVAGRKKYLLDEIYDRTIKMECERRYCQKFLNSEVSIIGINVCINISGDDFFIVDNIKYSLEDYSYPTEMSDGSIKDIKNDIRTGEEELEYLRKYLEGKYND